MKQNQRQTHSEHGNKIRERATKLGNHETSVNSHASYTAVSAQDLVDAA